MLFAGFLAGFSACAVLVLTTRIVGDRRQRSAFVAELSPVEREALLGFEEVRGDWLAYRDLLHRANRDALTKTGYLGNAAPVTNEGPPA